MFARVLNTLLHLIFRRTDQKSFFTEVVHSQGSFPWPGKFSTVREVVLTQGSFPRPGKPSAIKQVFYYHRSFPQSSKDIFPDQEIFMQEKLPQAKNLSLYNTYNTRRKYFTPLISGGNKRS